MPEEKSRLLEEDLPTPVIKYSQEEAEYLSGLQTRLTRARNARDQARVEWDGQTYVQYCESNRKMANSYIEPRQNREDTNYQSGIIRHKMMSLLAAVNNLDLTADVNVFDKDEVEVAQMGQGLEDINWKTEELDKDEEKKLSRQYNLLEQGTVFVNEDWVERMGYKKEITSSFDGTIASAAWNKRLEKVFEGCSRDVIQNEKVYLGDITQFQMSQQPYVFTVEVMPYDTARQIYGNWERWQFVDKRRKHFLAKGEGETTLYNSNFILTQIQDEQVEIIKYQDKPNNEFQIIINSIPMIPLGFPMPWAHGEYSVVKQILSMISPHFAYGRSFPADSRLQVGVLDETLRAMVLKNQKSLNPPRANNSGRVLSSRINMPGVILNGIDPGDIELLDPEGSKGVTSSEVTMLQMIQDNIDNLTVNPTFTGQNPEGSPTATQIIEVQRQARLVLGLTIFVCSQLEKKLSLLRIKNIMEHWFDPFEQVVDPIRQELQDRYRTFSRRVPIEGFGIGQRITRVTTDPKSPFELFREEEQISEETGIPTRITEMNPEIIKNSDYQFYVAVVPREKRTSPSSKLIFREMLADLQALDRPDRGVAVEWSYIADRFAVNWEENSEKMFRKVEEQEAQQLQGGGEVPQPQGTRVQRPRQDQRPRVNLNVGVQE